MKNKIVVVLFCLFLKQGITCVDSIHNDLQAVVLAGGKATRFKTGRSKLLEPICGRPMILHCTRLLEQLAIPTIVLVGYQAEQVIDLVQCTPHAIPIAFAHQTEQKGTGHAVQCTKPLWTADTILVINGDMPLITARVIQDLYTQHQRTHAAVTIAVADLPDPSIAGYGRIVKQDGRIAIVEQKNFTLDPYTYFSINAGIYIFSRAFLDDAIEQLIPNALTGELYLTDLIQIASGQNAVVTTVNVPFNVITGVNNFSELNDAEQLKKNELVTYWMSQGVRFSNPETAVIDLDVTIGAGTVIGSGVHLLQGTCVGTNCTIEPFALLSNVTVQNDATVAAFSVMRG